MFYTVSKKYVRHFLRVILPREMPGFILIGRDVIDQWQGFTEIFQRKEAEVGQFGIGNNKLSGGFRMADYRMDDTRIVKRCPEQ